MKINSVKVATRHPNSTDLLVDCTYDGARMTVETVVAEGRDLPTTTIRGMVEPPSEEFVVALHDALDREHRDLLATELNRICD